ncbi:MAG TPA: hypothetical protein GX522_02895 [Firmicutes bacterium]|jgi:hypothetical protein|nr:hypothetical protein [Bacillota bacterium]
MNKKTIRENIYECIRTGIAKETDSKYVPHPTKDGELALEVNEEWFTIKVTAKKKFDTDNLVPPKVDGQKIVDFLQDIVEEHKSEKKGKVVS